MSYLSLYVIPTASLEGTSDGNTRHARVSFLQPLSAGAHLHREGGEELTQFHQPLPGFVQAKRERCWIKHVCPVTLEFYKSNQLSGNRHMS